MAILAGRKRDTRKGEMREVEMWPGMVVSLIDRPWFRVLRAGRGRASLAWGFAKEREGAGPANATFFYFRRQLECHLHRHTESTGPREGSVASLN